MKRAEFIRRMGSGNWAERDVAFAFLADRIGLKDEEPNRGEFKVGDRVVITQTGTAGTIATDDGPQEVQRYFVATRGNAGVWLDAEDIRHADPAPEEESTTAAFIGHLTLERDAARAEVRRLDDENIRLRADLAAMTKERDALRRENAEWHRWANNASASLRAGEDEDVNEAAERVREERDAAIARAEKAERERDVWMAQPAKAVEQRIAAAVAAEREACAKIAEEYTVPMNGPIDIGNAIRARGESKPKPVTEPGNAGPPPEGYRGAYAVKPCSECDGYYKGPPLGDEPCPKCHGTRKVPT